MQMDFMNLNKTGGCVKLNIVSENEISTSENVIEFNKLLKESFSKLGKLESSTDTYIEGKIKYGLQSVKVRVSWANEGELTRYIFQGKSDDIWNKGGKNAVSRLIEVIKNHNVPGYEVDRLGMHPAALAGAVIGLIFIVIFGLKILF